MTLPSGMPEWWLWEIELSAHLLRRMVRRGFGETDLRTMLADADSLAPAGAPDRWLVGTNWQARNWEIVVEPDPDRRILVVVTAYMLE